MNTDDGAGLIGHAIPDVEGTEPRLSCIQCGEKMQRGPVTLKGEHVGVAVKVQMPDGWRCTRSGCGYATIHGKYMEEFGRKVDHAVIEELRARLATVGSGCVCQIEDGLVREWVQKARAVARSKGYQVGSHGNQSLSEASGSAQSEAQK